MQGLVMKYDLDDIRFRQEKELEGHIGLKYFFDETRFDNRFLSYEYFDNYTSTAIEVTNKKHPKISKMLREIEKQLELSKRIELFVFEPHDNVFSDVLSIPGKDRAYHIFISKKMVDILNEQELRFCIAHEVGHHLFGLLLFEYVVFCGENETHEPSEYQSLRFSRLIKCADVSCDRIGYLIEPNLDVISSVIKRVNSNHTNWPDILDAKTRIDCLKLFKNSHFVSDSGQYSADELELKTQELLKQASEKKISIPQKRYLDFFSGATIYLANINPEEFYLDDDWTLGTYDAIISILDKFTEYPESYLDFDNQNQLTKKVVDLCKYYAKQDIKVRKLLLEKIFNLANLQVGMILDSSDEDDIKTYYLERTYELGKLLKLSESAILKILNEKNYLFGNRQTFLSHFDRGLDSILVG